MVTVVASWDSQTGKSRIHLVLDSSQLGAAERRQKAGDKVRELEAQLDPERYEVILGMARSLHEFRQTDARFWEAEGP